jgi:hypothetical protein
MIRELPATRRELRTVRLASDLVIVGGGLAGTCCAITAARVGLDVVLIQDRPVLGGNASSEVRLWILGATSHMGNNNRWAREGGVIDEILVENMCRNPEGNALILDTIVLEKVVSEPRITLLLNTAVHDLQKAGADTITSVRAFCSQNSTDYVVSAPLFCDASGDGILGFLAGAAFRMGSEASSEFGEALAGDRAGHELLGHSIYFYSKDTGRPVEFVAPSFALKDITRIPRYRDFKAGEDGCRLWWIEWGGDLDTVHDTEAIKWELWKVAYGVWDHIKNSGQFPEAETLTLEWVGTIPGKRESRRFEGDHVITQQDIVEQRHHHDAVSFGGWAIDLHPSDGVYSERPGCQQWHSKGVYEIPYRSHYSRNISNLFLAGRIISASHVAFGSTRVMATCAHGGQAVGMAAAVCREQGLNPRDVAQAPFITELQRRLLCAGQYIPNVAREESDDLATTATITASSEFRLSSLPPNGDTRPLDLARGMLLPVTPGPMPTVTFTVDVAKPTTAVAELRVSSKAGNHTPDVILKTLTLALPTGPRQAVTLDFACLIGVPRYAFVCLMANPDVVVHLSDQRVTGVLSVSQKFNRAVAKSPKQEPPADSGIESFEFWLPERRPGGHNLAITIDPPIAAFGPANLANGVGRPTNQVNAWVAALEDEAPTVRLSWPSPRPISRVELVFDTDFDHPMESVLLGHPERVMPFCVRDVVVSARANGNAGVPAARTTREVTRLTDNHQTLRVLRFDEPVTTDMLDLRLTAPGDSIPAALFEVRCY